MLSSLLTKVNKFIEIPIMQQLADKTGTKFCWHNYFFLRCSCCSCCSCLLLLLLLLVVDAAALYLQKACATVFLKKIKKVQKITRDEKRGCELQSLLKAIHNEIEGVKEGKFHLLAVHLVKQKAKDLSQTIWIDGDDGTTSGISSG